MACLSWTAVAWSAEEGAAVESAVKEAAMASATFSETRDKQAVLKLYTKDYVGIQDGETETRESIEKWLSDYESELNKGNTLRFISIVSNMHAHMLGPGLGNLRLCLSVDQERGARRTGFRAMHHDPAQRRFRLAHPA
jgi:hypothetical protein